MAGWSSPHTFVRFYYLGLDSTKCSRPNAAHLISHRSGTRCYGGVVLTFLIAFLTQRISLERECSVTTVTLVP